MVAPYATAIGQSLMTAPPWSREFVAWVGAVLNTRRLPDQRWFVALLWTGIAGLVTVPPFGLGALIATVLMLAVGPVRSPRDLLDGVAERGCCAGALPRETPR